jgi:uracil phosphoribosyltransferase
MKNLIIIDHPLIKRDLTILRNKKTLRRLNANSTIVGTFFRVLEMLAIERSGRSK